jgi:NosR/NirI family nitrous oxide reductase transcriptional regulator
VTEIKKNEPIRVLPDSVPVNIRPAVRPSKERFSQTDMPRRYNVADHPIVARILAHRATQFLLILPNQIIFWMVIFLGFLGVADPGLNFATAITWYLWFCLVFVMMAVIGRAWCSMCPFGGFAEWIQRKTFFKRLQKHLGLGLKLPESVARWGFLISVATFLLLTFIEEFFNIAGPGVPRYTSLMVLGIVVTAVTFFLVFERRTFCRYFCPLSALIGSVGSMGSVAGFRTKDRDVCMECRTKDCMRGGSSGYGCPWYTWPGSAESNMACGLCTECYKACPSGNVGLFVQPPLTSIVAPHRRRADLAWAVAVLWGLVIFQQVNATNLYTDLDNYLNKITGWPQYPNPIDYFVIIGVVALLTAGIFKLYQLAFITNDASLTVDGDFIDRKTPFRAAFLPLSYAMIPVVGMDYFARQLPKFFKHVPRLIPSIAEIFGVHAQNWTLATYRLLPNPDIINVQLAVMVLGAIGSVYAVLRIFDRDLAQIVKHPLAAKVVAVTSMIAFAAVAGWLYVIMHAAS